MKIYPASFAQVIYQQFLTCEKELELLQRELLLCTGVFQGKRKKELQGQIADKEQQTANTKQRLGDIVRGHGYSSVDSFMEMYRRAKADYADYTKQLNAWANTHGMRYVEQQFAIQQQPIQINFNNPTKR